MLPLWRQHSRAHFNTLSTPLLMLPIRRQPSSAQWHFNKLSNPLPLPPIWRHFNKLSNPLPLHPIWRQHSSAHWHFNKLSKPSVHAHHPAAAFKRPLALQ